ncbi:hypothetical protein [Saccharibacter sp. 17.LH.SD]|uniref:hypothetical protein n=1 Tax=Saccharibacter sp. 17.LH.SD TaxID=2689393 RepID=UPI0019285595|nr:hypothetical protein [Saccharibacter sp. 17.LH.SD]
MEVEPHSAREFLEPKVEELFKQAVAAGFPRDEVLAVLIDLLDDSNLGGVEQ